MIEAENTSFETSIESVTAEQRGKTSETERKRRATNCTSTEIAEQTEDSGH